MRILLLMTLVLPMGVAADSWNFDGIDDQDNAIPNILTIKGASPGACANHITIRLPGKPEIIRQGCQAYAYSDTVDTEGKREIVYRKAGESAFKATFKGRKLVLTESNRLLDLTSQAAYKLRYSKAPIVATKAELQQNSGRLTVTGIGLFRFPWYKMSVGEKVIIFPGVLQTPKFDSIQNTGQSFRVYAPESIDSFTFRPPAGNGAAMLGVRDFGANLTDGPAPWSFIKSHEGSITIQTAKFAQKIKDVILSVLYGNACEYDFIDVKIDHFSTEACDENQPWVITTATATRRARVALGEEIGFPLVPVQRIIVVEGDEFPTEAASVRGVTYLNKTWFDKMPIEILVAAAEHEQFHSTHFPIFGRDRSNWITESAAVWFESYLNSSAAWRARYPWKAEDVERGLTDVKRSPSERYNPFFFLYLQAYEPDFNMASFFVNQAAYIVNGDGVGAFTEELSIGYDELRTLYGKAAKVYHEDNIPLPGVNGLLGIEPPEQKFLDNPTDINVGTSITWPNMIDGQAELRVTGNILANNDTLIVFGEKGKQTGTVSMDGAFTAPYPLGTLETGDYTITVSSVQGIPFGDNKQFITVEMHTESALSCQGIGPYVVKDFEWGIMYDANCAEIPLLGPCCKFEDPTNTPYFTIEHKTHDCSGQSVEAFSINVHIGKQYQWPKYVVGRETEVSIDEAHWPSLFYPGEFGVDACDLFPEQSFYIKGNETVNSWEQQFIWLYDCEAAGNCDDPNRRPPGWGS